MNNDKQLSELKMAKEISTQNPKRAFEIANQVLENAQNGCNVNIINEAYFHMAYACRVMSEYSRGLEYAFNAMDILAAASKTT